jgi:hypothetical protein
MATHRKKSTGITHIRTLFFVIFGTIILFEAVVIVLTVNHRNDQKDVLLDQRDLFRAREALAGALEKSKSLSALALEAAVTGDLSLRKGYESLAIEPNPSEQIAANASETKHQPVHFLDDIRQMLSWLRRSELLFKSTDFNLLERVFDESADLLATETKAFHALEGSFEDSDGAFTITGRPDPALARKFLKDPGYLKKRAHVNTTISDFVAAIDVRIFSSLNTNYVTSSFYSNAAVSLLSLVLAASPVFAFLLYTTVRGPLVTAKVQSRKMKDELARVHAELGAAELERNQILAQQRALGQSPSPAPTSPGESSPLPFPPPSDGEKDRPVGAFGNSIPDDFLTRLP